MAVYCVSYDLNRPGQNYDDLIESLKASAAWWHNLDSTWLIYTSETAGELSRRLFAFIDKNDSLLVIRVRREHAGWLTESAWKWIDDHVFD